MGGSNYYAPAQRIGDFLRKKTSGTIAADATTYHPGVSEADLRAILPPFVVTGLAGLAAGAFSMAAGEYTSVASQRELVQAELDVERIELDRHPEDELRELAALYVSRGVEPKLAQGATS